MWATGPERGCPSHAGQLLAVEALGTIMQVTGPNPLVHPALPFVLGSPVRLLLCSVIQSQLLSPDSLPPLMPELPGGAFPAAAFRLLLTFAEFAQ